MGLELSIMKLVAPARRRWRRLANMGLELSIMEFVASLLPATRISRTLIRRPARAFVNW
jgi:hypothetical protein